MSDAFPPSEDINPLSTLVAWPTVFAGAAVAVATGAMLNFLGVALGAGTFNPFDTAGGGAARTFTVAAGVWVAIANAIALFFGAVVASRVTKRQDQHGGMLHGLLVWAVAFLIAMLIAGWAEGSAAGAVADGGATTVTAIAAAPPTGVMQSDGTYLQADGTVTNAEGAPIGSQAVPTPAVSAAPPPLPTGPRAVANTAGSFGLWAFLTMLLGAAGAVLGGRYGARRHSWETRLAKEPRVVPPR